MRNKSSGPPKIYASATLIIPKNKLPQFPLALSKLVTGVLILFTVQDPENRRTLQGRVLPCQEKTLDKELSNRQQETMLQNLVKSGLLTPEQTKALLELRKELIWRFPDSESSRVPEGEFNRTMLIERLGLSQGEATVLMKITASADILASALGDTPLIAMLSAITIRTNIKQATLGLFDWELPSIANGGVHATKTALINIAEERKINPEILHNFLAHLDELSLPSRRIPPIPIERPKYGHLVDG